MEKKRCGLCVHLGMLLASTAVYCQLPRSVVTAQVAVLAMQARARDLFYGLWTTDLFMQRVEANADWSLFCPNEAPGLADCWGEEHSTLYTRYEREGRAKRVIKAQQLWFAILEAQVMIHLFPLKP